MPRLPAALVAAFILATSACTPNLPSRDIGGRELRPPRSGIKVGSLYFVRETPTMDLTEPANLEKLCVFDLANAGVALEAPERVADIDLLRDLTASGELDAIKTQMVAAGLSGDLTRYFSFRLTNAYQSSISLVEAETLFNDLGNRRKCEGWRGNIDRYDWAAYQVQSVIYGDLEFDTKSETQADAGVAAKLRLFEPKLKAAIGNSYSSNFTGKGLVISFLPIPRN